METSLVLFVFLLLLAIVAGPILAGLALSRASAIGQKLAGLEREIARLARELAHRPGLEVPPATPVARPEPPPRPQPQFQPRPQPAPPAALPSPPRTPPAVPIPAAAPAPPPTPPIDWERWLGIRGAAVLGAIALALAGLLFFKYSIDRGLLTPMLRVVLGTLTGLVCLGGSEALRKRYRHTADGVAGAGVVILYAAFWAAHALYRLIEFPLTFGLMVLVTVVCALLALRRDALVIAVLGLVGGFATPLLLASERDRPIGLFGYVLLLDLGLLALARKRNWPSLTLLSLAGTVLLQGSWIGARMGPERALLGLGILALFAVLFAAAGRFAAGRSGPWIWTQFGAILFPFAFALYFAARVDLGPHLWPLALLLSLLGGAAGFVARERGQHALGTAAAAAAVAVVAVWTFAHTLTAPLAWELVAAAAILAAVFHVPVERDPEKSGLDGPAAAALVATAGFFFLLLVAAGGAEHLAPWPWLAGWLALSMLAYRHAGFAGRAALQVAAAVAFGSGFSLLGLRDAADPAFPAASLWLALAVAAAIAAHAVVGLRADPGVRRFAEHAAAALALTLLVGLAIAPRTPETGPLLALGAAILLGVAAALAAARLGEGLWSGAAMGGTVLVLAVWVARRPVLAGVPQEAALALGLVALAVLFHTAWPFLAARRLAGGTSAWHAAALAGPLAFLPAKRLFELAFGDAAIGLLPLTFGALSLAAALRARAVWPAADPSRLRTLATFAAVALCFVAIAIPLQLEKEWITIGWALQGLAVIALWRRLDHPGLKYFGTALLALAALRLTANPAVLGYHPRDAMRIVNWLAYTYLVPAAAMALGAALLHPLELTRLRPAERERYPGERPLLSIVSFGCAVAVLFVWINLAIADWFATGPRLTLSFGDTPAQRLTMSIAWAVYAVALLLLGMRRDSLGLRWVSLGFLLVTIAKVFLYDLGALRDLYRVASLVGLAISLILVSLLYQRFVFRRGAGEP